MFGLGKKIQQAKDDIAKLEKEYWDRKKGLQDELDLVQARITDVKAIEARRSELLAEARRNFDTEFVRMREQWVIERGEVGKLLREEITFERKKFETAIAELRTTAKTDTYMQGYNAGFSFNIDVVYKMLQDKMKVLIQREVNNAVAKVQEDHAKMHQNHAQRVQKAASPQVVMLHDLTVQRLQRAEKMSQPEAIKEAKAQLTVLKQLMGVNSNEAHK